MGKYPNSDIHDKYSDWHYGLIRQDRKYQRLWMADVDRLWIEYDERRKAVVGIFDIKWENSSDRGFTATEKGVYDWFESKGVPVFTVFIKRDFRYFHVYQGDNDWWMTSMEYADWLLSLRMAKPVMVGVKQLRWLGGLEEDPA